MMAFPRVAAISRDHNIGYARTHSSAILFQLPGSRITPGNKQADEIYGKTSYQRSAGQDDVKAIAMLSRL